jgi:hypothetical protein
MGFCVYVGNDCGPKHALGFQVLFKRVLQARDVEKMAAEWQVRDPHRTAEQIFITRKAKDPRGVDIEEEVSLAMLKWEMGDLQDYLGECGRCKANVATDRFSGSVGSGFGCFLELPTPLERRFEEALVAGTKQAVEHKAISPAIEFLHRLEKAKVTGATMSRMRSGDSKAFESATPLSYTYGGFLGKKTVTTDQLLEKLLAEKVGPEDTLLYHNFLENTELALEISKEQWNEVKFQVKALSAIFAVATELRVPVYSVMRPG